MIAFLDTSALVKRYLTEPGSAAVRALVRKKQCAVVRITYAEHRCGPHLDDGQVAHVELGSGEDRTTSAATS